MHIVKKLIAVLVILVLVNVGFIWYGQASFDATVKTLGKAFAENNETLPAAQTPPPAIIASAIQKSGVDTHPYTTLVLQFEGDYRSKPAAKWMPMHALALLRPTPDMLWGIRLESNPIVTFNALETYHAGRASMEMLLFGIIPTGKREGEAFARSELARVLAYGLYNPALLSCGCIEYRTIDDRHVEATIHDGNLTASVVFAADESGDIVEVTSRDRLRPVKGGLEPTGWRMRIDSYTTADGLRIPGEVEESWIVEGNTLPYSRGRIASAKRL
ncbi:DUF6544 family protein [Hydrogenimonas sp.]